MNDTPVTLLEDHRQRMWSIYYRMQDLVGYGYGHLEWIAAQDKDRESREYWGQALVLTGAFEHDSYVDFFVEKEDFDLHSDMELAHRFAELVIGYPVNSPQHIARSRRYIQQQIDGRKQEIQSIEKDIAYWQARMDSLQATPQPAPDSKE